jgi:hypothetical protein
MFRIADDGCSPGGNQGVDIELITSAQVTAGSRSALGECNASPGRPVHFPFI